MSDRILVINPNSTEAVTRGIDVAAKAIGQEQLADHDDTLLEQLLMDQVPEAQTIYDEAKTKFEGRPAELSFLRMAAVESGLNP